MSTNNDIVVTKLKIIPDRRIEMMIVKFAGFLREMCVAHYEFRALEF